MKEFYLRFLDEIAISKTEYLLLKHIKKNFFEKKFNRFSF